MTATHTAPAATHTAPAATLEVAQLHPDTLDIGENVRDSVDLAQTPDFVESIRENGVLEAISAGRTADGTIVVRDGQRRTFPRNLACCAVRCCPRIVRPRPSMVSIRARSRGA
ncbi:hypothetical protein ACIBM3_33250 [Rhodococcus erythropolis]|uniref:hypothetical protein n=1 Tax=Rhodococcus erythropolis TaxID=1833 RepID=UPI00378BC0F4